MFAIKVKQELIHERFIIVRLGSLDYWVSFPDRNFPFCDKSYTYMFASIPVTWHLAVP
jgi:hypothetical protein